MDNKKGLPYKITIELSNMEEMCVREIECDDGEIRRCACIPIQENYIREIKKHFYLNLFATPKVFDKFGQSHFLTIMMNKEEIERYRQERGFSKVLGNVMPIFKVDKREIKKEITIKDL